MLESPGNERGPLMPPEVVHVASWIRTDLEEPTVCKRWWDTSYVSTFNFAHGSFLNLKLQMAALWDNPSIHVPYFLDPVQSCRKTGTYPTCYWVRGMTVTEELFSVEHLKTSQGAINLNWVHKISKDMRLPYTSSWKNTVWLDCQFFKYTLTGHFIRVLIKHKQLISRSHGSNAMHSGMLTWSRQQTKHQNWEERLLLLVTLNITWSEGIKGSSPMLARWT